MVQETAHFFHVADARAAARFYCDVLGFEREWEHQFEPTLPVVVAVRLGALRLFLTEHRECGPAALVYAYLGDVDGYFDRLACNGYSTGERPEDKPWGTREFAIHDLDGNVVRFGSLLKA